MGQIVEEALEVRQILQVKVPDLDGTTDIGIKAEKSGHDITFKAYSGSDHGFKEERLTLGKKGEGHLTLIADVYSTDPPLPLVWKCEDGNRLWAGIASGRTPSTFQAWGGWGSGYELGSGYDVPFDLQGNIAPDVDVAGHKLMKAERGRQHRFGGDAAYEFYTAPAAGVTLNFKAKKSVFGDTVPRRDPTSQSPDPARPGSPQEIHFAPRRR